ncbi:hypothetical protein ATI61_106128 [Archangium gephyra]|uniref:Uncharacterized protein n=2 Tax=Archangium gephyra TaxID=48 RepID=A0AAC8Q0I2_9BACT|nr:Hypothetical protein AA314_00361 [Archangium gephyra]REG30659.1 hypothetical protein ATI61_106128 [Archangium gephyra]
MLLGLLCLSSLGCDTSVIQPPSEQPPPSNPDPQNPSLPAGTSLLLQVVDESGSPVPGAAVSSQGTLFPVDSSGHLLLENLPHGRFLARVDALGFTSATTVVELQEGAHVGTQVKLLRLPAPLPFQAEQGGVLETAQVRVTIPPDAVVDALGQPVTGTVQVTIAPLDPTHQLGAMPGPLEGTAVAEGERVQLESFFMAEVSLWSNGAPVRLAPGKSATLEFVLPEALASQFHAGDTVPAWWFDLDAGHWREEGAGTIQPSSTQPGRLAWVAQVKHFTWWNCDLPWTEKSCVNVLVVDGAGAPIAGARVTAEGVSYSGNSGTSYTGGNGRVCIEIKRGNTARIVAARNGLFSEGVMVTGSSSPTVCGSGPCTSIRLTVRGSVCTPGASERCSYTGPAGTEGQGLCRASRRLCNVTGTGWGACEGQVLPTAESCSTPFDDDCNGQVNEGCSCSSQHGQPCYGGPEGTRGVGICRGGTVECDPFGRIVCQGQQLPQPESCSTLADDNCNGINEVCEPLPRWFWGLGVPTPSCTSTSKLVSMAVDGAGNTLTLSSFTGTITLGGPVFTGNEDDLLLAKVGSSGLPLWTRLIDREAHSPYSFALDESLAVDAAGNVLVTGRFSGTVRMGSLSLTSPGESSSFVVKLTPSGDVTWAQRFGGGAESHSASGAIATDATGNVALLGMFNGTLTLGGTTHASAGSQASLYVARLDAATGEPLWSRNFQGRRTGEADSYLWLSYQTPTAIEMDEAGDVLIAAGFISGSWSFLPRVFVEKLSGTTGTTLWNHEIGGIYSVMNPRLKASGAGTVLVAVDDAPGTFRLSKLSANGEELWSVDSAPDERYYGTIQPGVQRLTVDAEGNAVLSGAFRGRLELGGGLHESSEPTAFVVWYDSNGRYVRDQILPRGSPTGSSWGTGVGVDRDGNVLLGGWFSGTADFGTGPVSSCANNTFVLKVDATPPTPPHFSPIITRAPSSLWMATPGEVLTFEVDAVDSEGSELTFSWAANVGTLGTPVDGDSTSRMTWTAPSCERASARPTVSLTVTNAFNLTATRSFQVWGLPSCE